MTLAVALDTVVALALVALAAAWLGRRLVRTFSRRGGGGCACPSATEGGSCGAAGRSGDLAAAAARGAAKAAERAGNAPERTA